MESKTCIKCGEVKPLDEYHKHKDAKDGHLNTCKKCVLEYKKEHYLKNKDKILEYHKEYNSKTENKDRVKCRQLQKRYGITVDEYNQMYNEQEGRCAICGTHQSELDKGLAVDHDHETGEVRSLLCKHCNLGLGNFKENVSALEAAITYLEKHKK